MSVLLSVQGLTKSFSVRPLFEELAFDLRAGERVGLIGPNGAGKSTLLKILAGLETTDAGTRTVRRGCRIGYLAQDDVFGADQTLQDVLVGALAGEAIEDHERYTRAAKLLTQFGFDDPDKLANTLSGGWRKRLSLAKELIRKPDLLLLDEPTNHLDLPGVVWLEKLLRSSNFGYLVATHDRAFLRAVADDILEINRIYPGGSFRSPGGYDDYAENRDLFLEAQAKAQESLANQVRRETEWLGHKARARTRKASSRIEAAANRREELAELKYRTNQTGAAGIDFVSTGRQTKKLLTALGVSKTLGNKKLFGPIDVALTPGAKLGLLGPNGCGKSTLLRVLAGEIASDTGTVTQAEKIRVVMFEQGRAALDPNLTLRRSICPNGDSVTYRDRQIHVGGWAKQFLFRAEQLDLPVGTLSGGEQARVRIAQLMLLPADVLLLDEPTNDLDIPALEVLEDSLSEFPGAVVLVTHDRDLMDRLCTEVIGLDGRGAASSYGSVDQWLAAMERVTSETAKPAPTATPAAKAAVPTGKTKKLSYNEQKELDGIEAKIHAAEELVLVQQANVEAAATKGHTALNAACQALEESQKVVEKLYARWEELEGKRNG